MVRGRNERKKERRERVRKLPQTHKVESSLLSPKTFETQKEGFFFFLKMD
jgi:hypothetical protein